MSSRGEAFIEIDPLEVRFTHSRVRPFFSGCGRRLQDTLEDLATGRMDIEALPVITILRGADGVFFSLNNRRLWVLKELRRAGELTVVRVRIKELLAREVAKYSADKCSLTATIMREREAPGNGGGREDEEAEGEPVAAPANKPPATPLKPLPPVVLKAVKHLQEQIRKKKGVMVQAQLDEWIHDGVLAAEQEAAVWLLIRA